MMNQTDASYHWLSEKQKHNLRKQSSHPILEIGEVGADVGISICVGGCSGGMLTWLCRGQVESHSSSAEHVAD